MVVYRHAAPHGTVVVGVEFFAFSASESGETDAGVGNEKSEERESESTLLGFRSLWTEHAHVRSLGPDERITGISVKRNLPSQWRQEGLGLEEIKVFTTPTATATSDTEGSEKDGWMDVKVDKGQVAKGVWAVYAVSLLFSVECLVLKTQSMGGLLTGFAVVQEFVETIGLLVEQGRE